MPRKMTEEERERIRRIQKGGGVLEEFKHKTCRHGISISKYCEKCHKEQENDN